MFYGKIHTQKSVMMLIERFFVLCLVSCFMLECVLQDKEVMEAKEKPARTRLRLKKNTKSAEVLYNFYLKFNSFRTTSKLCSL